MDESRKQFQKWWEEWFGEAPLTPWDELWYGDGYYAEDIDHMWDAWQASRAAIEIELPDEYTYDEEVREHASQVISDCAESIRAAGIKVKE